MVGRVFCLALIQVMVLAITCTVSHAQFGSISSLEEEFIFFEEEDVASIGSLRKSPIFESPGIISVITSKTISSMPARFLTDILKSVPGFDVRYSNDGRFYVPIRGLDNPSNTLVMINGRRLNDFYTGAVPYDILVDGIERLEIIRGPGSALYGTNAISGVINVITKKELGLKVNVGMGSFDTYKGIVQFGHKLDDLSVYGYVGAYDTDGADTIFSTDRLSNQGYPASIVPSKINDDKYKVQGRFDVDYKDVKLGFDIYDDIHGPNVGHHDVMSKESVYKSRYASVSLGSSFTLPEGITLKPSVYMNRWKVDNNIQITPDGYTDNRDLDGDGFNEHFADGQWITNSYESWTRGADLQFGVEVGEGHSLTAGFSYEELSLTDHEVLTNYSGDPYVGATPKSGMGNWNGYEVSDKSRTTYTVFLQDEWRPNELLNIVAGVRYGDYSDFESTTNPRLAVSVFPMDNVDVKFQYATAFRAPTFKELYDDSDTQLMGNPNLNPVSVETVEMGVGYTVKEKGFVRLNVFRNVTSDDITTLFEFSRASQTYYQNVGEQSVMGWELELKYAVSSRWNIYSSTSFFNARDKLSDSWLTRVPQIRFNVGVNVMLPKESLMSVYWLHSGSSSTNKRTLLEKLPYFEENAKPYNLVNVAFTKKNFLMNGVRVKLSVFNLLNIDYRELATGVQDRFPGGADTSPLVPSNQRSFLLEIGKDF